MFVKVNVEKYKEFKKKEIREERKELFSKLDVEFMRAVEEKDQERQDEIVALKKQLRDATNDPTIAGAVTPEALKDARPVILDTVKNR